MTGSDRVYVHGLELDAVIGVHAWEREIRQRLVLDLDMAIDNRAAARRDALEDALDYQAVATRVSEFVAASRFRLVESLAEAIAELVQQEFAVTGLRLRLAKPGALPGSAEVGVCIDR